MIGVISTPAEACCYTNKKVHNNTGVGAYDFKIVLGGARKVLKNYNGFPWSYRFRKFKAYVVCGSVTVLRWWDPVDPTGAPGPIPHCAWVHIGYRLDRPARVLLACWTDNWGRCICTTRVRQPGHNVIYPRWPQRVVNLTLYNDLIEPSDTNILVQNVSYAVVDEELPLEDLNDENQYLKSLLKPLDPSGQPSDYNIPPDGNSVDLEIPEPLEPGQVLVYRFEVEDPQYPEQPMIDFGQHKMEIPMPVLLGDISGPQGVPDLHVDFYDIAVVAKEWLKCNDPTDPACIYDP